MSGRTVTIRYAKALYDVASQQKMVETVTEDLLRINEIVTTACPIREYCLKRHADHILEMKFIETAFLPYVRQTVGGLLKIAVRNGRLAAVPYLYAAFKQITEDESGVTEVVIESARELEENFRKVIEKKMSARIGRKVRMSNIVVPGILGGIRILWNNRIIDLSARGRLRIVRTLLKAV